MSTRRKLPPDKGWDLIETMALEDEADRVVALSDRELDRELSSHGLDPESVRARGAALAAKLAEPRTLPAVAIPMRADRPASKHWSIVFAAAAATAGALAIAIATVVLSLAHRGDIAPDRSEESTVNRDQRASLIRQNAGRACEERRWEDCRTGLDAARALDPAGEEREDVGSWRRAIEESKRPELPRRAFPDTK